MGRLRIGLWIIVALASSMAMWGRAHASQHCAQPIARIVSSIGAVEFRPASERRWRSTHLNLLICPGDGIRTGEESRVAIVFPATDTILRIDQNTTFKILSPRADDRSLLEIIKGALYFFSRTPRALGVRTPFVNAGIEGTEFSVDVAERSASIIVFEGRVRAGNDQGSIVLTDNQRAVATAGQAPRLRAIARPRDAVRWTLFYPPVFTDPAGPASSALLRRVSRLLAAGRAKEASNILEGAKPQSGDLLALRAVIAVVLDNRERALDLGRRAVQASQDSASARIALSYAQQASFDLEAALDTLQRATERKPADALAWARLAEVWLSLGYLDQALQAARTAASLAPRLSRTNTVLGFAYLTEIRIQKAKAAFLDAISLDSQDPLPRLGLGLAKIRDGDLAEGRRDLEIAAALDPGSSIIRSYLGKAYFDEKRGPLDADQLAIAKKLDPKDPTPWLYDAIRKQTENRPVEALQDLQKSIELNDNRAVYRSRLLLDEDLAGRSASLARIYNDLGFEQLALAEGWKSVNTSPGNHSAHRFLADTYSALPRHEIARVSELLQAQLRQPINLTPVQPQLAESNLFILEGAGPSEPSFNEFGPLFARNRIAVQADGITGNDEVFGNDVTVAAVSGRYSLSFGRFQYDTDGIRENNDQDQEIYDVFAQVRLSHKTSVQAELRSKKLESGDLNLLFFPNNFSSTFRQRDDIDSIRFGLHHVFSPKSDLIANVSLQSQESEDLFPGSSQLSIDADGYTAEIQHLYKSPTVKFISGAGHAELDNKTTLEILFLPIPPTLTETEITHDNVYLYSHLDFPGDVTVTLGGSADFFKGEIVDRNQVNPKLGLMWSPNAATTIRAAVFRTLKRTLLSNQTLEPTQVAGFNQFFDDPEGTDSWRYGIAVDQKFSKTLFGGVEFSKRDLTVSGLDPFTSDVIKDDFEEYLARVYLSWAPHPRWALSADYQYERLIRSLDLLGPEDFTELTTHKASLGAKYFHPTGFKASAKATFIDQSGQVGESFGIGDIVSGNDQFWILDASLGYRFPNRFGLATIGVKNALDQHFNFQDTDPGNPRIAHERFIFLKLTIFM